MKKYSMLIITILMIIITTAAYTYENNVQAPQIKQPSISIDSEKFGVIKKIVWTNKFMGDVESLIILSTRNSEQGAISYLYHLSIYTGKSELLAEFPAHKTLNDVILFDSNYIIVAYDKGIEKVNYQTFNQNTPIEEKIEIANFDTATSMDFKGNFLYTLENDNLLYKKNLSTNGFLDLFANDNLKDITKYYTRPLYVANFNSIDNIITYTSIDRNKINLYMLQDGATTSIINKPVIENVVSAQGIEDSYGFAGMNILSDSQNKDTLNLFMIRRTIDIYNNDDYYSLDTFPYNTDLFGAVPAVDSTTLNREFALAYTTYDENHKGRLKICKNDAQPKVIVKDENIFGPISMIENHSMGYILYFTLENNNIKIKVCDEYGDLVKDITDIVIKND